MMITDGLDSLTVKQLLNCLFKDMTMLKESSWQPDDASCEANLDVIRHIAGVLGVELDED